MQNNIHNKFYKRRMIKMKKVEGIKVTRILFNAVVVASVIVALTSGYKYI